MWNLKWFTYGQWWLFGQLEWETCVDAFNFPHCVYAFLVAWPVFARLLWALMCWFTFSYSFNTGSTLGLVFLDGSTEGVFWNSLWLARLPIDQVCNGQSLVLLKVDFKSLIPGHCYSARRWLCGITHVEWQVTWPSCFFTPTGFPSSNAFHEAPIFCHLSLDFFQGYFWCSVHGGFEQTGPLIWSPLAPKLGCWLTILGWNVTWC